MSSLEKGGKRSGKSVYFVGVGGTHRKVISLASIIVMILAKGGRGKPGYVLYPVTFM
jgi:hypothetical protein